MAPSSPPPWDRHAPADVLGLIDERYGADPDMTMLASIPMGVQSSGTPDAGEVVPLPARAVSRRKGEKSPVRGDFPRFRVQVAPLDTKAGAIPRNDRHLNTRRTARRYDRPRSWRLLDGRRPLLQGPLLPSSPVPAATDPGRASPLRAVRCRWPARRVGRTSSTGSAASTPRAAWRPGDHRRAGLAGRRPADPDRRGRGDHRAVTRTA